MAEKPAKNSCKMFRRFKEEFSFVIGNVFILLAVWAFTDFAHLLPDTIIRFTLSLWAAHLLQ
ncbi:MAG: hypothetical protein ACP5JW_00960 [Candidatus Bathyarchaeia archaeon]